MVRIRYLSDGREVAAAPSDEKGRYEIEGLAHGYVEMTVERDGEDYWVYLDQPYRARRDVNGAFFKLMPAPSRRRGG